MLRHTILFKTKHNISDAEINSAISQFLDLKYKLKGIISIMGGICHFNEKNIQQRANDVFTHAISIDFETQQNLIDFFENPVTHPAKGAILSIVEGGYNGVIGFEIESS